MSNARASLQREAPPRRARFAASTVCAAGQTAAIRAHHSGASEVATLLSYATAGCGVMRYHPDA